VVTESRPLDGRLRSGLFCREEFRLTGWLLDPKQRIMGSHLQLSRRNDPTISTKARFHSSVFARLASGAFYESIVLATFYEVIKIGGLDFTGKILTKEDVNPKTASNQNL